MLLGRASHYFVGCDLESEAFAVNIGQNKKDTFQEHHQHASVTNLSAIMTRSRKRVELCTWHHDNIRKNNYF